MQVGGGGNFKIDITLTGTVFRRSRRGASFLSTDCSPSLVVESVLAAPVLILCALGFVGGVRSDWSRGNFLNFTVQLVIEHQGIRHQGMRHHNWRALRRQSLRIRFRGRCARGLVARQFFKFHRKVHKWRALRYWRAPHKRLARWLRGGCINGERCATGVFATVRCFAS